MSGFKQGALSLDNKQSVVLPTNAGDLTLTVVGGDIKITNYSEEEKTLAYVEDISGGVLDLTVSSISGSNSVYNVLENINTLRFDSDGGFDVVDLGDGAVKITMNSTFKFWEVNGQDTLEAVGLDTVEFVAGNGITITTDPNSSPQQITFTADVSGGSGFTPLEGEGITITPSGDDYIFEVSDYISKTEVANITGDFVQKSGDTMTGPLVIQGVGTGLSLENTGGASELEISSNSSNYSAVELSRFDGASKIKQTGLRSENPITSLGTREKSGLYVHGIDDYILFYSTEFGLPNLNIGNYSGTLNSVYLSMDYYAEFSFSDDDDEKYDVWLSAEENYRLWFNQSRACHDVFIFTGDAATSSSFVVRGGDGNDLIEAQGWADHPNATYGNGQKVIVDRLKLVGFGGNTVTNELVLFTETGGLSASGYTLDDITDLIDSSQILDDLPITRVGKVDVQQGLRFYTIEHDLINPEQTVPLVSLTIPTSADEIFVQGITDVTSGSFDVILSGTPTTSGYEINWELSTIGKGYTVKQYGVTETTSTTVTPDLSKDHVWNITLQDSTETIINAPINMNNGQSLVLVIEQGGAVGSGTISWNSEYLFPGNVTTVATSGQGMADLYSVTKVKNRYFTSYAQEYNVL